MPADGGLVPLIVFLPLSAGKPLDRVVMLTVAIPPGRTSGVTRHLVVGGWPNGNHYVGIAGYLIAAVDGLAPAHAVRRAGSATADCPARCLRTSWAADRPLSAGSSAAGGQAAIAGWITAHNGGAVLGGWGFNQPRSH
jgi:hypothetical protein